MTGIEFSVALFVLAGPCEMGGGYLVWQWWRNGARDQFSRSFSATRTS